MKGVPASQWVKVPLVTSGEHCLWGKKVYICVHNEAPEENNSHTFFNPFFVFVFVCVCLLLLQRFIPCFLFVVKDKVILIISEIRKIRQSRFFFYIAIIVIYLFYQSCRKKYTNFNTRWKANELHPGVKIWKYYGFIKEEKKE